MASYRRAAWNLCWWGCLLGFFQVAEAARIDVPLPSVQDLLNRANPVINENSLGYVQAHDSAFQYQQRSYSAPIKQSIKVPSSAIKDAVKGSLKANAAAVAMHAAMAAAVAAAGWVIDEAGQPVKKTEGGAPPGGVPKAGETFWQVGNNASTRAYTADASCRQMDIKSLGYDSYDHTEMVGGGKANCYATYWGGTQQFVQTDLTVGTCPAPSVNTGAGCSTPATAPLQDADFDTLTDVINQQSADFRARLAKEACEGSLAPERCYKALQDAASFLNSGPSSIQGPKTTSQTVNKNADGTVSTETTTRDTKFDMKYDGTGADATPTTTTTKRDDKGNESVTTDKEAEDSSTGTAPKEDDKETASPCTTNCDGPAYKDLYTKTDVTKEGVLDTYAAKVKALPIMSAVGNFFTVNGGGSCPVWSGTIDIGWGQSVTLSNDFACQPWFTALSPAFHAVLMLVAAWLAFRVSILD